MCFPAAQRRQRVSVSCMNSERGQNTFSRNTGHKPLRWWKDERCLFAVWSFGGFSNSVLLLYWITRFQSLVEVHYDNLSLKLFNGFLSEPAELWARRSVLVRPRCFPLARLLRCQLCFSVELALFVFPQQSSRASSRRRGSTDHQRTSGSVRRRWAVLLSGEQMWRGTSDLWNKPRVRGRFSCMTINSYLSSETSYARFDITVSNRPESPPPDPWPLLDVRRLFCV